LYIQYWQQKFNFAFVLFTNELFSLRYIFLTLSNALLFVGYALNCICFSINKKKGNIMNKLRFLSNDIIYAALCRTEVDDLVFCPHFCETIIAESSNLNIYIYVSREPARTVSNVKKKFLSGINS